MNLIDNKTTGQIASELLKNHTNPISPIEVQAAQEKEYLDNLLWAVQHAQKKVSCDSIKGHDECKKRSSLDGDFYISVLLKKEKLLENVLRNYFIPTKVCPTPGYDQTVYKYDNKKETIELLWVVPDKETCEIFRENFMIIVPGERGLLKYVLDFYDGTLFRLCKKLNGEKMSRGVALEGV